LAFNIVTRSLTGTVSVADIVEIGASGAFGAGVRTGGGASNPQADNDPARAVTQSRRANFMDRICRGNGDKEKADKISGR
jgi:hypothetical protein